MAKNDFTIFKYSTMLALTRAGITTFEELEKLSNAEIANIRGLGKRRYDEILGKIGRSDESESRHHKSD